MEIFIRLVPKMELMFRKCSEVLLSNCVKNMQIKLRIKGRNKIKKIYKVVPKDNGKVTCRKWR